MKKVVVLEWVDASINLENDSMHHDDAVNQSLIHGFVSGILIKEDKDSVTIARDWFDKENTYRGIATYPKKLILHRVDRSIELEQKETK